jgi:predicted dienelactone hydrolase
MLKLLRILFGSLSLLLLAGSTVQAAERITGFFGPLQFSLSVDALKRYAEHDETTSELAFYTKRLTPEQRIQFRQALQTHLSVSPILLSQVGYSEIGTALLQQAGKLVQTETGENGFYALRSALILSATDPNDVTPIQLLQNFPSRSVRLNFSELLKLFRSTQATRQRTIDVFHAAQSSVATVQPLKLPDLQESGQFSWKQQTWTFQSPRRNRAFPVDFYLPNVLPNVDRSIPVIVIVHGAVEDRQTFAYLAKHLASYGFAVVVPENPTTSQQRWKQFLQGVAPQPDISSFSDQALDVREVLDELQSRNSRLNLEQVGVIGHSQGGSTALLLAGATVNPNLRKLCQGTTDPIHQVQCRAEVPGSSLRDARVKSAIAINPVTSLIFGQQGMSQIQTPVMLISGSSDLITPALSEQICPFTSIRSTSRYLALVENGTHLSMLGDQALKGLGVPIPPSLIGPSPEIARSYLKTLGVAFMQRYVGNQPSTQPYLTPNYSQFLSQPELKLTLLNQLKACQ